MKRFDVIASNPMITSLENGKYFVVYANPAQNWEITKYDNLTLEEVAELPFVNKFLLNLLK